MSTLPQNESVELLLPNVIVSHVRVRFGFVRDRESEKRREGSINAENEEIPEDKGENSN